MTRSTNYHLVLTFSLFLSLLQSDCPLIERVKCCYTTNRNGEISHDTSFCSTMYCSLSSVKVLRDYGCEPIFLLARISGLLTSQIKHQTSNFRSLHLHTPSYFIVER